MGEPGGQVLEVVTESQLSVQEEIKEGVKVTLSPVVDLEVAIVVIVAENSLIVFSKYSDIV